MIRHAQNRIRIEGIEWRQLIPLIRRGNLVRKSDAIRDLRAELKPLEIEVAAKTHFCKIVHQIHQHGFVSVAAYIETGTSSGNYIRTVVAFALRRPFQIERQVDRNSHHIDVCAVLFGRAGDGSVARGLIVDLAIREEQTRAETQVEVPAQAQVRHEAHMKTGQ